MLILLLPLTDTFWVSKPINETTKVALDGASIENFPSKSVETDFLVPETAMFAPGTVNPFSSDTIPSTLFWATIKLLVSNKNNTKGIAL
ncbi:hypothetical protein D3C80_982740 [compost metagenome]